MTADATTERALELHRARIEKDAADRALSSRRGILVARVQEAAPDTLPPRVANALTGFRAALEVARARAAHVVRIVETIPREGRAVSAERARVSALIAYHLEGLPLVASDTSEVFRWRVVKPDGSHANVGPYATDRGILFRALERLAPEQRRRFAEAVSAAVCPAPPLAGYSEIAAAVLDATVPQLARAALEAVGVDPDTAEPPTLAQ